MSNSANSVKQSTSRRKRTTKTTWSYDDTLRLIEIVKSTGVQRKLDGMVHNHKVWKDVAAQLDNTYSADKCHDKWTYLKRRYREILRNNNSSGSGRQSFIYFEELDSVLGHRPMSGVVNNAHLDSSSLASTADTEDSSSDHKDNEVPDEDDIVSQNSPQAGTSQDNDENDGDTSLEEQATPKQSSNKRPPKRHQLKGHRSMSKVVESAMATLVTLQDKIDEREDKRCKQAEEKEEQRLKEERERTEEQRARAEEQRRWEYEQEERRLKEHRDFMLQLVQMLRQPSYPPNYPNPGNGWNGGPTYNQL